MKIQRTVFSHVLIILVTILIASISYAGSTIRVEKDVPYSDLAGVPVNVTFNIYDSEVAGVLVASETFPSGTWWVDYDFTQYKTAEVNMVRFKADFTNTVALSISTELWLEIDLDGVVIGSREQIKQETWSFFSEEAVYAYNADTVDGIDSADLEESAEIDSDIAIHTSNASAHHTKTTSFAGLTDTATDVQIPDNITVNYAATAGDANTLDSIDSTGFALSSHDHDTMYYTQTQVDLIISGLQAQIDALNDLLQHFTRSGNDVYITGANLHIESGSGTTDGTVNSLGNLIVGYNELRGTGDDRTGSHNIVAGKNHNYTSYGGIIAGNRNEISGPFSSVSGGYGNTASGQYSSVSGGIFNIAGGVYSSVSGGYANKASYTSSSVSGGNANTASGQYSSVSGGMFNTASDNFSSVSGGYGNTASGQYSSVSGGNSDSVSGIYDWRAGDDYFSED